MNFKNKTCCNQMVNVSNSRNFKNNTITIITTLYYNMIISVNNAAVCSLYYNVIYDVICIDRIREFGQNPIMGIGNRNGIVFNERDALSPYF